MKKTEDKKPEQQERRREENAELRAKIMKVISAFRKYHGEKDAMLKIFARQEWEGAFIEALDVVHNLDDLGILKQWAPETGTKAFRKMLEKIAELFLQQETPR